MNGKIKIELDKITDFLKSLKELINSAKELLLILFPFFGFIIALFNFDKFKNFLSKNNILSENLIDIISNNTNGIISMILVIALIVLIFAIKRTAKKEIQTSINTYSVINKLHNEFSHKLRDGIYNLYLKNERVIELKMSSNNDAIKEVQERAFDNLILDLQSFVDLIADYLSSYNMDVISVCIKIINPGQDNVEDKDKMAKTLVRSKNTKRERKRRNENIILGNNSDFKHLCDGTNIWYHGVDLKTMYDNGQYKNEAEAKDWQDKYNSTIVVPIRYYEVNDRVSINDILGFLCIDSKNIIKNWDDINSFELQYLAIFADSIYTYIKLFKRLFEEG